MTAPKRDPIAKAAMFIALCSLVVSVWSVFEMRLNYRLSVKPALTIKTQAIPNGPISITIRNNGLGPAIVRSHSVRIDGRVIYDASSMQDWDNDALKSVLSKLDMGTYLFNWAAIGTGSAIPTKEDQIIFSVESKDPDYFYGPESDLFKTTKRIKVRVIYESMYGEKFLVVNYD